MQQEEAHGQTECDETGHVELIAGAGSMACEPPKVTCEGCDFLLMFAGLGAITVIRLTEDLACTSS
jgi:hypothetical protein